MSSLRIAGAALAVTVACAVVPSIAGAAEPGFAAVELEACSTGKTPAQRWAVFRGEMHQIPAAAQMRMRFDLAEKIGKSVWRGVGPLAVGEWHVSDPGVEQLIYRQRVENLKPATAYRVDVYFRWVDGSGEKVAQRILRSVPCRQRGKLPNLALRDDVHGRPGPVEGTYRYAVYIRNNGLKASPPSEVRLAVDGAEVDVRRVGRLRSGEKRIIRFVGPACARGVTASLDPNDVIREITERDNVRQTRCAPPFIAP
jgi:hypothetical protein